MAYRINQAVFYVRGPFLPVTGRFSGIAGLAAICYFIYNLLYLHRLLSIEVIGKGR